MPTSFLSVRNVIVAVAVIYMFATALLHPESRYFSMILVLIGSAELWKSYVQTRDEKGQRTTIHR